MHYIRDGLGGKAGTFFGGFYAVTIPIEAIWSLADMAVGFIVIPNMIAILLLSGKFVALFREYMAAQKEGTRLR